MGNFLLVLRIVNVPVQQRRLALISCVLKGSVVRRLEDSGSPCVLIRMGSNAPERVFIDRSFENKESMSFVVGINRLTTGAKVLRAVRTAVPLSNDLAHVLIAESESMCEVTEIGCSGDDE